PAHVQEYDAISNTFRETGPPVTEYESEQLRSTTFYDGTNRVVSEKNEDVSVPSIPPTEIRHIFDPALPFNGNRMELIAGEVFVNGQFTAPLKAFTIDHPLDPYNKKLRHISVESPDMMNIYNGNVTTDEKGYATVTMPDYFAALNMDFRYQLTAMGVFSQAIVKEKIADNKFVIQTDKPNVEVSWQVTGIRHDTYAKENRIQVEVDKTEAMKGKLLYEPKKELGNK
ncbi:MAG: hypothetical protein HKN75_01145, partial [Bacteroidia bacterium]|nr:hypothetical protein [Bacteroidia bacterium]